ncbi:DUF378 domain-containing protein [Fastidiosibacter lacustris]|uniref:DUF378 domain-containing protein n=1 Tax=Fastidiosibacter lacustris TaxID=2056695 RepID=UPI000E350C3F|nr:DUF378 domain-containing protein [Fastidiosibacter lacustris]
MRFINTVLMLLTIIGGFNWFTFAVFNFNIIATIFSNSAVGQKIVYVIVGLSALYCLSLIKVVYKSK